MRKAEKPFESYLKEYLGSLYDVINETYESSPEDVRVLFEFINNWIDLVPAEKTRFLEATNSLSGIILLNSWKLINWISFEVLCGKYFEALRNLRFIFEACIHAVVIEDLIESKIWRKWGSLSSIGLKTEIFKLWETCRSGGVYDKKRKNVRRDKVREIVEEFIRDSDIPSEEKAEYAKVYVEILSQPEFYMPTESMVRKCCKLLGIEEEGQSLKDLWHELSRYQHFSYPYLEITLRRPEFVFLEEFDEEMFKLTLGLYHRTLDFLYAVLAWRFVHLRKEIVEVCTWWRKNLNRLFTLTEKVLGIK